MSNEHFPVSLRLRIDWSELDLFCHVNNVMFMKYIQASRVNYWEQIGIGILGENRKTGPMLASTTCQYKKPLHYPGNITIKVRMEFMKTTSFGLHHLVIDDDGDVAAEAHDVVVMYDFSKGKKIPVPEFLRVKMKEIG